LLSDEGVHEFVVQFLRELLVGFSFQKERRLSVAHRGAKSGFARLSIAVRRDGEESRIDVGEHVSRLFESLCVLDVHSKRELVVDAGGVSGRSDEWIF